MLAARLLAQDDVRRRFRERVIGDVQMLLTKPDCRRAAILPPLDRA